MMPLCTTEMPPLTCGCALISVGLPCVAQRVCAMPIVPFTPLWPTSRSSCATRPVLRTRWSLPFTTAMPAESSPRYSSRLSPSMRMGTTLRRATAPTIPHMSVSWCGDALIDVLDSHDVVLAEVGSGLHLDDLQRHLAGVLEAVQLADRDVERPGLREQQGFLAALHARGAAHHDPLLGAVGMPLPRKLL